MASVSAVGIFSWDEHRITDEDIKKEVNDIMKTFTNVNNNGNNERKNDGTEYVRSIGEIDFEKNRREINDEGWQLIYDKKDLIIWKRKIKGINEVGDLFEYKVLGRMYDITPLEFYQTQIDLDFRKQWDYLVVILGMIEKDTITNTELVRWIMRFPYPLYPREYVYVRRYCVDLKENLLILVAKGLPELNFDQLDSTRQSAKNEKNDTLTNEASNKNYVRVTNYKSNFIVIPHSDFDKPGMNYVIQYYDINKANIPKVAYSWMAASGLPDYIERLHNATMKLRETKMKNIKDSETCESLLKNELAKYEVFCLYTDKRKDSSLMKEMTITETQNQSNSGNSDESKEKVIIESTHSNNKSDNQRVDTFKKRKSKKQIYLEKILEKLNSDYFSQSEPHEVFYNF